MNRLHLTIYLQLAGNRLEISNLLPFTSVWLNKPKKDTESQSETITWKDLELQLLPNQTDIDHPCRSSSFQTNFRSPLHNQLETRLNTDEKSLQDQPPHLSSRPERPLKLAQAPIFSPRAPQPLASITGKRGTCVTKTLETGSPSRRTISTSDTQSFDNTQVEEE